MRARNLKPSLFKNEVLGSADPLLTILFEGLWCEADRDGRLEDRPLRLRAEIFPYRHDIDMDAFLNWLATNCFISRYEANGLKVIQVLKFSDHQHPHNNEVQSVLPPKDESKSHQGRKRFRPNTKALGLIPSSLTPDSLNHDKQPSGLDVVSWNRWLEYRSSIRRPLKPVSIPAAQRKLAAFGAEQAAVVEQSIANGWQGIFEIGKKADPAEARRQRALDANWARVRNHAREVGCPLNPLTVDSPDSYESRVKDWERGGAQRSSSPQSVTTLLARAS